MRLRRRQYSRVSSSPRALKKVIQPSSSTSAAMAPFRMRATLAVRCRSGRSLYQGSVASISLISIVGSICGTGSISAQSRPVMAARRVARTRRESSPQGSIHTSSVPRRIESRPFSA